MRRFHRNVYLLGLLSFFNDVTSDMITPFLPAYLATLGYGAGLLGVMEGFAQFVSYGTMLLSGWFSDKTGHKKKIAVWGYSLSAVCRTFISVPLAGVVLFARLADRLGKGIRSAPRDALLTASTPKERWAGAFGLQRAMDHGGALLGASLGAFLLARYQLSFPFLFLVASLPALLSVMIVPHWIQDFRAEKQDKLKLPSWTGLSPTLKKYYGVIFLSALSTPSELFLILYMQSSGMPVYQSSLAWLLLTLMSLIAAWIGGILGDRWSRRKTMGLGWLLFIGVFAGFAFQPSLPVQWILLAVFGFQTGLVEAPERAYSATLAGDTDRATVLGGYYMAYGLGLFPASVAFGWIWKTWNPSAAFLLNAGLTFVALMCLFFLPSDRKKIA